MLRRLHRFLFPYRHILWEVHQMNLKLDALAAAVDAAVAKLAAPDSDQAAVDALTTKLTAAVNPPAP